MTSAYSLELLVLCAMLIAGVGTLIAALLILANFVLLIGGARLQARLFTPTSRLRGIARRLRLDPPQSFFGTGQRVAPIVWLGATVILPAIVLSPVSTMSDRFAALALVILCLVAQAKLLSLYFERSQPAFVPENNTK